MAKTTKIRLPKHYSCLDDLPIGNWWDIEEKNDLRFLLVFPRKIKPAEKPLLMEIWTSIIDEFIDHFGINSEYKQILQLRRDIEVCAIDYILTKDRIHLTEKKIYERQLEALTSKKIKNENDKALVYASRFMHFRLDKKQVTVKEFYTILATMNEMAANQTKEKEA